MVQVVFLHPDLGIGGAERLVVDAALAFASKGHQVHIITSHHDPNHCFPETSDGTIPVTVSGAWIPRSLCGRFLALCAYLRMLWACFFAVFSSAVEADVFFCDQISIGIPVLRLFARVPVLFYCHFPDLLLASRKSWIRKSYRLPLDWLEEKTTGMASAIVVNSQFTAGVFRDTFQTLNFEPQILYPSLHFDSFDKPLPSGSTLEGALSLAAKPTFVCLSVNRYERKKNLGLALEAFAKLQSKYENSVHLVMAGGYDDRVAENVQHYAELQQLADELQLKQGSVTFLRSPDDAVKTVLLKNSHCLIYTPDREHFGIVPLEAMYNRLPVVAVNSGGPLETVEDGGTGFLCPPTAEDFAQRIETIYGNREMASEMGRRGRARVLEKFSFQSFANQLDALIDSMSSKKLK